MFGLNNTNEEARVDSPSLEGSAMNNQPQAGQPQAQADPGYQRPPAGHPYAAGTAVNDNRRKSPVLATFLSCFPGLGQVYVGFYQVGFLFIIVTAGIIGMLNSPGSRGAEPFLGVFLAFFWIFNMIDANRRAQHYNRVVQGLAVEELPEGFPMGGNMGSVPVGVILVAAGFLFILDLNFGVSLEWIENWWPLALVGFGGWLIYKARKN
jgi:hypothetical protein